MSDNAPDRIWTRDLDGTGSQHPCWPGDDGATEYMRADLAPDPALSAALDGVDERAKWIVERLRAMPIRGGLHGITTASHAADLITALLARIAAMEVQIKGLEGGIEAACNREAETERKLRTALAASETHAEAAETALAAMTKERDYADGTNEVLRGENQRLETALAAERSKVAKLVEALKVARAHVANNADGWSVSRGAARVDLTIVDAAITEASQ